MNTTTRPATKPGATPVKICALTAMSPMHVGTDTGLGLIDKPVMRERATGYPLLPGSALKGVVRASHAPDYKESTKGATSLLDYAFGKEPTPDDPGRAGSLIFTDVQLLALPVRSFFGTTAWVTTPYLLKRHAAQLKRFAGIELPATKNASDAEILIDPATSVLARNLASVSRVVLEDFDLESRDGGAAGKAWSEWIAQRFWPDGGDDATTQRDLFAQRFGIVSEDLFDHLCRYGLELRARIKIEDDTHTAEENKLWYEELLPEGSLMLAYVFCERVFRKIDESAARPEALLDTFCPQERYLQFGGTASVGRGLCRVAFHDGASSGSQGKPA